jgi:uncharacterized membrane protein YdbT with pleckstrin-like domain
MAAVAAGVVMLVFYWANIQSSRAELALVLGVSALGLVFLLSAYLSYRTTEFAVTDRRIIAKTGLVSRKTVEMFLDKVESINIEQGVAGRVLNYGTVGIRGTGVTEEAFRNISSPLTLRKQFMAAADVYRRKV